MLKVAVLRASRSVGKMVAAGTANLVLAGG